MACGNSSTITLTSAARRDWANTGDKMLNAGRFRSLAGGDCIDDAWTCADANWWDESRVLGCVVKAPSTLGDLPAQLPVINMSVNSTA